MKTEQLSEGWVSFTRWHCKEGCLDRWIGDSINNPNNATKHQMCLNSTTSYWRYNGEWINEGDLKRNLVFQLLELREEFTAEEIWEELISDR